MSPALLVAVLTLAAVALIPVAIGYYLWLARHVAPRLVALPTRLAVTIVAIWVALPWILLTAAGWLLWG